MKYKRILLKLSGEALAGSNLGSIKPELANFVIDEIREAQRLGAKMAIVVGGGNIYRGGRCHEDGIQEETAHYMGMLAICINALALSDLFTAKGLKNKVLTAIAPVGGMDSYSIPRGKDILDEGEILILSGGTGKPFVSSDSGAALRASELGLDVVFKMTKVDGVFDSDPVENHDAKKYDKITFDEVLDKNLKVMDHQAISVCKENGIPIIVFKMEKGNIKKAVAGETIGTIIE